MKSLSPFASVFRQGLLLLVLCIGAATATLAVLSLQSSRELGARGLNLRAGEVTGLIADLGGAAVAGGDRAALARLLSEAAEKSEHEMDAAIVLNRKDDALAVEGDVRSHALTLRGLARTAMETGKPQASADGFVVAYPIRAAGPEAVGAIAAHWNLSRTEALLQQNLQSDLIYTAAVFVMVLLLGMLGVGRWLSRPLVRLSAAVRGVAHGDYGTAIPGITRSDEVGGIGRALDELRAQLAAAEGATLDARYKGAAFEGSSAAMMLIDKDLIVRHVNPAMRTLLEGFTAEIRKRAPDFTVKGIVGTSVERFHGDNRPMRRLMAQSESGTAQIVMKLGDRRLKLSIASFRNTEGVVLGSVMEWQDVTDEAMNAAVLDAINADQCRAEFDTEGRLILCNDRFAQALGTGADALKTRRLDDLVAGDWREETGQGRLLERLAKGETLPRRIRLARAGGGSASFDCGLVCVRDPNGVPQRYLFLGRDISADETRLIAAEAERAKLVEAQGRVVDALRLGLRRMREGNLMLRIDEAFPADYEELRGDYNSTLETLAGALGEIADNASNIFSEARDISSTADTLSRRTESTAATLEETAAALDQLTSSVRSAAERAAQADDEVGEARRRAEKGGEVVIETVAAMDRISTSSDRITSITNVIEDIAFQTNLLALNAGVEAARAGEAGRGFAVVASEVRALAQRCSEAAREINELIADSGTHVKHGVALVGQTGDALREIVKAITGIATLVSEIAGSARQQSAGLAEINAAVNDLDQSTQQNAARLEETTAASQSLTNDAMSMVEAVSHFDIGKEKPKAETVVPFSSRREAARTGADHGASGGADHGLDHGLGHGAGHSPDQGAPPPRVHVPEPPRRAAAMGGADPVEADPDGWSEY